MRNKNANMLLGVNSTMNVNFNIAVSYAIYNISSYKIVIKIANELNLVGGVLFAHSFVVLMTCKHVRCNMNVGSQLIKRR